MVYGPGVHLYQDAMEGDREDDVFLELSDVEFSASNRGITVRIPAGVWEAIRKARAIEFTLVGVSDEALQTKVEGEVEKRLQMAATGNERDLLRAELDYFRTYGPLDLPAKEQVARGLASLQADRADQTAVHDRMTSLLRETGTDLV